MGFRPHFPLHIEHHWHSLDGATIRGMNFKRYLRDTETVNKAILYTVNESIPSRSLLTSGMTVVPITTTIAHVISVGNKSEHDGSNSAC